MKGAWWWNEEVMEKVNEMKEVYAAFMNNETDEEKETSRVRYKAAKKVAKKAVDIAKSMAYDRLYQKLGTKKGAKEVFKLARIRKRKTRDLGVVRCIKDENDKVLSEDLEIKVRWKWYFSKLLNDEVMVDSRSRERESGENLLDPHLGEPFSKDEIKKILKKMSNEKVEGPDQILVEV